MATNSKRKPDARGTIPISARVTPVCYHLWEDLAQQMGLSKTGVVETAIRRLAKEEGLGLPPARQRETSKIPSAAWHERAVATVNQMRQLKAGWDGYHAEALDEDAISRSQEALNTLAMMNNPPNRVAPLAEGGVVISFLSGRKYADIELLNTGEALAVTSDGSGRPHVWEVPTDDMKFQETMEMLREFIRD